MIQYGKHHIFEDDINAVKKVLKSDYITQGPKVTEFEKSICNYTKSKFAIAVNSGTSALHISCLSIGLSQGDYLWTSAVSFVASANCAIYCGAKVDFLDIDEFSWNICLENLQKKLVKAKKEKKLPKAIVVVHLTGVPCNLKEISSLCKKYNIRIIEDACHAIGGSYKGSKIGACKYSDITTFSFHPVKNITTGEGGACLTNNKNLADKMRLLSSHGIVKDKLYLKDKNNGAWFYEQQILGFNYRISDINAALGISQFRKLDYFIKKRRKIAKQYRSLLSNLPVKLPINDKNLEFGHHLFVIRIDRKKVKKSHKLIFKELHSKGIKVNLHYIPIYMHPYFKKKYNYNLRDLMESYKFYKETVSIPNYYGLSKNQQYRFINLLKGYVSK